MNTLLENVIKDRFQLSTVKMEHLRSSAFYEEALDLAARLKWESLEAMLRQLQIITNRVDMRHTKKNDGLNRIHWVIDETTKG